MSKSRLTDLLLFALGGFATLSFLAGLLLAFHSFGGGGGRYDLLVVLLGLPGSALLPLAPEPLLARHSDLFNVVVVPWLINSVVVLTLYVATRPFASSQRPHSS